MTEQIVEAGAKAMYERRPTPGITWESLDRGVRVEYRRDAQAALDAMLPLIRKQLADEVRGQEIRPIVFLVERHQGWNAAIEHAARLIEGVEG